MSHLLDQLVQHGFQVVQSLGIISSLIFGAVALRNSLRTQRVANLFQLTQYHRQLYSELFDRPELRRVFQQDVDLTKAPVTDNERLFVTLTILHFNLAFEAVRKKAIIPPEGLERDAAQFFARPIPKAIWLEIKSVQNRDLVTLLDKLIIPA
jgi:hypothetical protein